jgi:ribosomal protein S18 acetylase RimI-like enzyme
LAVVSIVPFEAQALPQWLSATGAAYVDERVAAGDDRDSAERRLAEDRKLFFPGDAPAPGHLIYRVLDDDVAVGALWIGPEHGAPPEHWWVWTIEIDEPFRGRGIGRAAMELAEQEARRRGAKQLGLNVFGANHIARSLYESLGYGISRLQMFKVL